MSTSLPLVVGLGDVDDTIVAPVLSSHARWVSKPTEAELSVAVGAIVRAHVTVDTTMLDQMPHLRVLARTGVGTEPGPYSPVVAVEDVEAVEPAQPMMEVLTVSE